METDDTGVKPATVLTEIVAPAQSVHADAELDMKTKQKCDFVKRL